MGYYTDYDISGNPPEVQEAIIKLSDYNWEDSGRLNAKWYGHEADCLQVSKQFPEVVIEVSGEGEESGDIWKAYYLNGKTYRAEAKITFEEFNVIKLV